jgi:hypothetical protein
VKLPAIQPVAPLATRPLTVSLEPRKATFKILRCAGAGSDGRLGLTRLTGVTGANPMVKGAHAVQSERFPRASLARVRKVYECPGSPV